MNVSHSCKAVLAASILTVILLADAPHVYAAQVSPPPVSPDTTTIASAVVIDSASAQFLMQEGDEYAEQLFDNQHALARYLDALSVEPYNSDILWRICRAYIDIAEHLPTVTENDRKYQLATYERAMEFANRSVGADPRSSMGYAYRSVATSRIAMFSGVWESSDLVNNVLEDVQRAVELDPNNSLAHYMLGRVNDRTSERPWIFRLVLGLAWADLDDAVEHYERAITLRPDFILYRLSCARAYFELDELEKAKQHLNAIETIPTRDEDDDRYRREAKELLEKIREEEE